MGTKSNYTKTLDKLQAIIDKELKKFGFTKKGRTYNKVVDDGIVHVIYFQSGDFPVNDKYVIPGFRESLYGQFTINLGVFTNDIYEVTHGSTIKEFISHSICQIRTRIPELTKNNDDWSTVGEDYADVAKEITKDLTTIGFKWLNNFANRECAIKSLQNKRIKNLYTRIGKLNAGLIQIKTDRTKGENLLREHHALSSNHKHHQEYVVELVKKIGIVI